MPQPPLISFVVQTGKETGYGGDKATKRRIRSHVMREWRLKRKLESQEQQASSLNQTPTSTPARKSRQPVAALPSPTSTPTASPSQADSVGDEGRDGMTERSSAALGARNLGADLYRLSPEIFNFELPKAKGPEMLTLLEDFLRFYTCSVTGACPLRSYWLKVARSSKIIFYAGCLIASAHIGVFNEAIAKDLPLYENFLIQSARQRLDVGVSEATTHEMITIVGTLSLAQLAMGGDFALHHLRGLKQIVDLRGGVKQIHDEDPVSCLVDISVLHDLVHSICKNIPPLLFGVAEPEFRTAMHSSLNEAELRYWDSPLFSSEKVYGLKKMPFVSQEVQSIMLDLAAALEMRYVERQCSNGIKATPLQTFGDIIRRRLGKLSRENPEEEEEQQDPYSRACQLACAIHVRAAVDMVPFEADCNQPELAKLESILRQFRLEEWRLLPLVYFWVIMVAGAASTGKPQSRLFAVELNRFAILFGMRRPHVTLRNTMNFMWLQKLLRGEVSAPGAEAARGVAERMEKSSLEEVESSLDRRWLGVHLC